MLTFFHLLLFFSFIQCSEQKLTIDVLADSAPSSLLEDSSLFQHYKKGRFKKKKIIIGASKEIQLFNQWQEDKNKISDADLVDLIKLTRKIGAKKFNNKIFKNIIQRAAARDEMNFASQAIASSLSLEMIKGLGFYWAYYKAPSSFDPCMFDFPDAMNLTRTCLEKNYFEKMDVDEKQLNCVKKKLNGCWQEFDLKKILKAGALMLSALYGYEVFDTCDSQVGSSNLETIEGMTKKSQFFRNIEQKLAGRDYVVSASSNPSFLIYSERKFIIMTFNVEKYKQGRIDELFSFNCFFLKERPRAYALSPNDRDILYASEKKQKSLFFFCSDVGFEEEHDLGNVLPKDAVIYNPIFINENFISFATVFKSEHFIQHCMYDLNNKILSGTPESPFVSTLSFPCISSNKKMINVIKKLVEGEDLNIKTNLKEIDLSLLERQSKDTQKAVQVLFNQTC